MNLECWNVRFSRKEVIAAALTNEAMECQESEVLQSSIIPHDSVSGAIPRTVFATSTERQESYESNGLVQSVGPIVSLEPTVVGVDSVVAVHVAGAGIQGPLPQ